MYSEYKQFSEKHISKHSSSEWVGELKRKRERKEEQAWKSIYI